MQFQSLFIRRANPYSFQGTEGDDEVKGQGNSYDFGARMLDARVGRWLSVDPLAKKQPSQSPYKSFLNNPLFWSDPDGNTEYETIIIIDEKNHTTTKISKVVSDKIRSDGVSNKQIVGTLFTQYDYYSFSNVTEYTKAADGSITVKKSTEILYSHGVQRTCAWDEKVIDPSDPFEQAGGFYMTGSGGQGTKYYSKNAEYVGDMDAFISLMKNYSAGVGYNIPVKLKQGSAAWTGLEEVVQQIDKQGNLIDKIRNIIDAVEVENTPITYEEPINSARVCIPTPSDGGCIHPLANQGKIESGDTLGGKNPTTGNTNKCSTIEKSKKQ